MILFANKEFVSLFVVVVRLFVVFVFRILFFVCRWVHTHIHYHPKLPSFSTYLQTLNTSSIIIIIITKNCQNDEQHKRGEHQLSNGRGRGDGVHGGANATPTLVRSARVALADQLLLEPDLTDAGRCHLADECFTNASASSWNANS